MESDMKEKQTFLREQILEKNYDAEEFVEYLNNKLHIGDNLELCTLTQLKEVVYSYI